MLLVVGTFAAILGLIVVPYWLFVVRSEDDDTRKLQKRMKVTVTKTAGRIDLVQSEQPLSNLPAVATLLGNLGFVTNPLRKKLLQAGLDVTVGVGTPRDGVLCISGFRARVLCHALCHGCARVLSSGGRDPGSRGPIHGNTAHQ